VTTRSVTEVCVGEERTYAHFVGVGGAGMSGIARVLHDRGFRVSGSDLKRSRYAHALATAGVHISYGHDAENVGDAELVVVSSAIPESNPEVVYACEHGIPVWPRAKMLADLAGGRITVAVAGTHGKTTTSSMVTTILKGVGADPTFLIGGELNDVGSNAGCGDGEHYVVEADESDGSFLFLDPHIALVTNLEADHLDHYRDLADVEETFGRFMGKVSADGRIVCCAEDARLVEIASRMPAEVVTYGRTEGADVRCVDLLSRGLSYDFSVLFPDGKSVKVSIGVPGVHNVVNATGALAAAWVCGVDVEDAAEALGAFSGVRRRFEMVGEVSGVTIIDDYAHHPTEVRATLDAAQAGSFERVWVVFQPHRYSRTAAFGSDFGDSFGAADRVVLMDVYSAGETPIPGVSGKTLVESVLTTEPRSAVSYFPHRADVAPFVASRVRSGDLVMTMGAGDVTTMGGEIVSALEDKRDLERRM